MIVVTSLNRSNKYRLQTKKQQTVQNISQKIYAVQKKKHDPKRKMNQINNKYICIHVNYKGIKGNFCAI